MSEDSEKEQSPNDTQAYRKDELRFRSLAALLNALPARLVSLPLFDRHVQSVSGPESFKYISLLHQISGLLTRYCGEVVAALPVKSVIDGSILVSRSGSGGEACGEESFIVPGSHGKGEGEQVGDFFVQRPEVPDEALDVEKYLCEKNLDIPFTTHVAILRDTLNYACDRKTKGLPNDDTRLAQLKGYCLLVSHRKNRARLLGSPKYLRLMKELDYVLDLQRSLPLPESVPYPKAPTGSKRYLSDEDKRACHLALQWIFSEEEREALKLRVLGVAEGQDGMSLSSSESEVYVKALLQDFLHLVVAVLKKAETTYSSIPKTLDETWQLRGLRSMLVPIGDFMSHISADSELLKWILEEWLAGLLGQTYISIIQGNSTNKSKEQEETEDAEAYAEEDADDIDNDSPTTISGTVLKWLKLASTTNRYCTRLSKLDVDRIGTFCIVGTARTTETEMEPWDQTVKICYRHCEPDSNWDSKAQTAISLLESRATSDQEPDRRWLAFTSKQKPKNSGVPHCEAVLAALHLQAVLGLIPSHPLLQHTNPFLGPSNPCCALCGIVISSINDELRINNRQTIPIMFKRHSVPCGTCSLPPGLPQSVRNRIIDVLSKKVHAALEDFVGKEGRGEVGYEMARDEEVYRNLQLGWFRVGGLYK